MTKFRNILRCQSERSRRHHKYLFNSISTALNVTLSLYVMQLEKIAIKI